MEDFRKKYDEIKVDDEDFEPTMLMLIPKPSLCALIGTMRLAIKKVIGMEEFADKQEIKKMLEWSLQAESAIIAKELIEAKKVLKKDIVDDGKKHVC